MKDFKIIELMELFDEGEVTTADKIDRPQSALDREMFEDANKRFGLSDGGGKAFRLKRLQEDYKVFGKKELDKGAKILGFKDYASMSGDKNSNFRRKIKKELRNFGEVLTEPGSRKRSREARIPKEQGIQIKLLEETNKKKFFDPKKFAKDNNISLLQLKKQAALLQKNIYNKRMKVAGKDMRFQLDWIPDDPTFSDNALNKLWKSKLIKYDKNKIDELFYQAFGNPKSNTYNPKKFLAIKKNLNEYRQLRDAINAKYPNINFELDHPLSKSSLNKIFNATTDQLTRVNVLESDLNNGFKDSLSLQYEKAVQSNNLNKKKAVEKIAKDLKLNIGKISDDATNFKYGVKEFQKLNIKDEIIKSVKNLSSLNKNFQTYVKNNPDLFKTAGVSTKQTFTKIKPSEVEGIEKLLASFSANPKCRASFNKGGRIGYATGPASLSECAISGRNRLEKVIKGGAKLGTKEGALATQILKAGRSLGSAFTLSGLFGPAAIAFTAAAEAGFVGYDMLTTGKTFKETIGDSLLNYALGDKTKIDPQKELFKRFSGLGYSDEQLGNFANVLNQTNQLNTILKQDLKVGNLKDQVKALREQPKDQFMIADDDLLQTDQVIRAEQKLKDESLNLDNILKNYRTPLPVDTGDFGGLSTEDTILEDMASGKFQDTQQQLKAANILADLEKARSVQDNFFGKFLQGDIGKQKLADEISGLEQDYLNLIQERGPQLTPFAGGGIAGLSGGIDEGPQVESMNPDSQGLQSLKNRARNI